MIRLSLFFCKQQVYQLCYEKEGKYRGKNQTGMAGAAAAAAARKVFVDWQQQHPNIIK